MGKCGIQIIYDNFKRDFNTLDGSSRLIDKKDLSLEEMKIDLITIDPSVSKKMAEVTHCILMEEERSKKVSANHES